MTEAGKLAAKWLILYGWDPGIFSTVHINLVPRKRLARSERVMNGALLALRLNQADKVVTPRPPIHPHNYWRGYFYRDLNICSNIQTLIILAVQDYARPTPRQCPIGRRERIGNPAYMNVFVGQWINWKQLWNVLWGLSHCLFEAAPGGSSHPPAKL